MSKSGSYLQLERISKQYAGFALKEVSFSLQKGDYFILLGYSGSGKSLVLETIAGLVKPDTGEIFLGGRNITHARIQERKTGIVFQDLAIFPHMTVRENIAYPLKHQPLAKTEKKDAIRQISLKLGIDHLLNRRPGKLSGGELQRVALARALVQKPEILLLDEPLSSLDSRLKSELRSLLRNLNRQGQSIIHVTHDYEEAISLGNRIAIMNDGKILQSGTPREVFSRPSSEFVAHFTGARNFFRVRTENGGQSCVTADRLEIRISPPVTDPEGFVLLRSEDIFLSLQPVETSAVNHFPATIREIIRVRNGYEVSCDAGTEISAVISEQSKEDMELKEGMRIFVHFKATAVKFIPA